MVCFFSSGDCQCDTWLGGKDLCSVEKAEECQGHRVGEKPGWASGHGRGAKGRRRRGELKPPSTVAAGAKNKEDGVCPEMAQSVGCLAQCIRTQVRISSIHIESMTPWLGSCTAKIVVLG